MEAKTTGVSFGYRKECHYNRSLFNEDELLPDSMVPRVFVKKDEHPELFEHVKEFGKKDLSIKNIASVILRMPYESICYCVGIEFYKRTVDGSVDREAYSAGSLNIEGLSTNDLITKVKNNVLGAL